MQPIYKQLKVSAYPGNYSACLILDIAAVKQRGMDAAAGIQQSSSSFSWSFYEERDKTKQTAQSNCPLKVREMIEELLLQLAAVFKHKIPSSGHSWL